MLDMGASSPLLSLKYHAFFRRTFGVVLPIDGCMVGSDRDVDSELKSQMLFKPFRTFLLLRITPGSGVSLSCSNDVTLTKLSIT